MISETLARLQEAEAQYRGIFENAVEGIYQSTPDGRYLKANAALAQIYGYQQADELLNQVSDIQSQVYVDPTFRQRFRREIEQDGFVKNMEYQVRRRDGTVIWISESARVVRDSQGAVRYYEGFIDNITARKEAEAERARLEKQMLHAQKMDAIGTLAGGMAHDFNNILCAILGYTEISLMNRDITGLTRENLQCVLKSAERAKDLVKRILTFSRPTEMERHPLRLSAVLKEAVKLLNATLPSSIEITVTINTTEDVIVADSTEMHQMIMNLGTNAGHALKPKGGRLEYELNPVTIAEGDSALKPGQYVGLVVRDSGHGMNRDVLERIFEPFFTTKPVGRGTGLGLTLVQKIVHRSGGHIRVESEEGHGTTFHIYLPHSQLPIPPIRSRDNQLVPGNREHILVVDDEIPVLSMMQQRLRQMGYRVLTRADSGEALDTFSADPGKFDLVITDHTMPGLQGAELAEKIGDIRPGLPLILMTGLNQPPDFATSKVYRRRAVISKPVNFVELSHRLRHFLEDNSEKSIGADVCVTRGQA
jgi:two-component system cell cycle sensor histidine kinase/response regulator CckA